MVPLSCLDDTAKDYAFGMNGYLQEKEGKTRVLRMVVVVACQIGSLTMSWMKWEEGLKPLLRISSNGELSIILVNKLDDEWATMHAIYKATLAHFSRNTLTMGTLT